MRKPRIAVLLDENTSGDGTRYEASKGYFVAIRDAGGLPFGIPYLPEIVESVFEDFDGVLTAGGRFAYPDAWYQDGETSKARPSDRLAIERALVEGYLARDKPILGICAGMQTLACMNGSRLTADLRTTMPAALEHDKRGRLHPIVLAAGSQVAALIGQNSIEVNSFHREALVQLGPSVAASAHAPDGVVEAIEICGHRFAIGVQWHQELFAGTNHPGNRLFRGLVEAAT